MNQAITRVFKPEKPKAVHLPDAEFNFFDNIGINIQESHNELDDFLARNRSYQKIQRSYVKNKISLYRDLILNRLELIPFLVQNGFMKSWFKEFREYWISGLGGRPIEIMDFFLLHHNYRLKAQYTSELDWSGAEKHLDIWQTPNNIFGTFSNIRTVALFPFSGIDFRKYLKQNDRILEYGCSHAPSYRAYRRYYNDMKLRFVLLDIPQFSFHYSKWSYQGDPDIECFHTLQKENFDAPFTGLEGQFSAVILHNVLEHVDHPVHVLNAVDEKLAPGGLLFFDYIRSEAKGQDSAGGLSERLEALNFIMQNFNVLDGAVHLDGRHVGKVVAQKK